MSGTQSLLVLIGRICLAPLFLWDGVQKILHWSDVVAQMKQHGFPIVETFFLPGAIILLIGGGVSVLLGLRARTGALMLIAFLVAASLIFHPFWESGGQTATNEQILFMKNLGLIGGLAYVAAFGAGRHSLDGRQRAGETR